MILVFFSWNALKCVSLNDQECKIKPEIININSNEPSFCPYSIHVNKRSDSNDIYAKLCVPDVIKDMNIKVFNLMSRTNETRHISWHETCRCKYRLDTSISNDKQRWNNDKCKCECRELIDKGKCDDGFIWNSSICKSECDKSCDIGEYLDYENCKCRKLLTDKLVEKRSEDISRNVTIYNATLYNYQKVCESCMLYIILLIITFIIIMCIGSIFQYFYWYPTKKLFNKLPY